MTQGDVSSKKGRARARDKGVMTPTDFDKAHIPPDKLAAIMGLANKYFWRELEILDDFFAETTVQGPTDGPSVKQYMYNSSTKRTSLAMIRELAKAAAGAQQFGTHVAKIVHV